MRTARVPDRLRHRPFTTAQAEAAGVSRSSLRSSPWRNIFRGVWVHQDVPDSRGLRFAAVRLILREGYFICGLTAAWLYGIDVQDRRSELIWVGGLTGHRIRTRAGCLIREITVADTDIDQVDGVWVTTPVRTAFDCGRWLELVEGVVVADFLAHAGLVSRDEIAEYTAGHRALRWVRRMDRVVELMSSLSESPMETRVRVLIVESGLPWPELQLVVLDQAGRFVARADLGYRVERFLVEYDGTIHWEQRRADDRRRDAMRRLGWEVLVISAEDYYSTPELIVAQVATALRRAGQKRPLEGV
jgi:AbiEi antitoxin C-terminal domain/Protein of unknown function (DUF559)